VRRPINLFKVPFLFSDYFVGRDDDLNEIEKLLATEDIIAITGLGGIGKTQLITHFCQQKKEDFNVIYWINAEDTAKIKSELDNLGSRLGIIHEEAPEKVHQSIGNIEAYDSKIEINQFTQPIRSGNYLNVIDWLNDNEGWLLVFDNVENYNDLIEFIPQSRNGKVILTSRISELGRIVKYSLKVLTQDSSILLLKKITGIQESDSFKLLANLLGHLPLALEQAGAYIKEGGISCQSYIDLFKECNSKVLNQGLGYTNNEATVATTWKISLDKVNNEEELAIELLNHCAFIEPVLENEKDDIPLKLFIFKGAVGNSPDSGNFKTFKIENEGELRRLLNILKKYSLINVSERSFSVHRLVQYVIRNSLTKEEIKAYIERIQIITELSFDFNWDTSITVSKKNESFRAVSSIVSSSINYNIINPSFSILTRKFIDYCLYVLNDKILAREYIDKYKEVLNKISPLSPLSIADFNLLESRYWFEVNGDNGKIHINEAISQYHKFYLANGLNKEVLEQYYARIKNVYVTLFKYGFICETVQLCESIIKKFQLIKDKEGWLQSMDNGRYYYYQLLKSDSEEIRKNHRIRIALRLIGIEKSLVGYTDKNRSCNIIFPIKTLLGLVDEKFPYYKRFQLELVELQREWYI